MHRTVLPQITKLVCWAGGSLRGRHPPPFCPIVVPHPLQPAIWFLLTGATPCKSAPCICPWVSFYHLVLYLTWSSLAVPPRAWFPCGQNVLMALLWRCMSLLTFPEKAPRPTCRPQNRTLAAERSQPGRLQTTLLSNLNTTSSSNPAAVGVPTSTCFPKPAFKHFLA